MVLLSREIMKEFARPRYLNWDNMEDREVIQKQGWSTATDLLVLDEIHKMHGWKRSAALMSLMEFNGRSPESSTCLQSASKILYRHAAQ